MAEIKTVTYRENGTFTFTASANGMHCFHIIGAGGNGASGQSVRPGGSDGGDGGGGGGYGIHELPLSIGDKVGVEISAQSSKITHNGKSVISTAANGITPGNCQGANVSNLVGNTGKAGAKGHVIDNGFAVTWLGGSGGKGADGVGKYQASGGLGGDGGSYSYNNTDNYVNYRASYLGATTVNTDTQIAGAGGGGGGGAGQGLGAHPKAGGAGQLGGVVIETTPSAPTAPSWLEVENARVVFGVDTIVKWGTSTDLDGDLSGYTLERSLNSGAWTELYKGSMRQMTDIPTTDWQTVQYRIKAYDGENQSSGYISTEKYTVIQNSPPSATGTLVIPSEIRGGSVVTASWGRATDADNNLVGYHVEQCVNGGQWEEIKDTTTLTADIPITHGWLTVQFRVRAYDSYGAVGDYVVSETANVINNRPPAISGEDRDAGTMISTFDPQTYIVTDEDGDAVTSVEKLDGVVKKTFDATLGAENTLEMPTETWRKVLNGAHTWQIIATDAQGVAATRTITFTKKEGHIGFTLTQPLTADAMPERCILSIQGAFPVGSTLLIEVSNNSNDDAPLWDDITNKILTGQKHYFANTVKTAEQWGLGIRASLDRGTATGDCYIHSIRGNYA